MHVNLAAHLDAVSRACSGAYSKDRNRLEPGVKLTHLCTGIIVPTTGIYRVVHPEHRLPPNVILAGGNLFPRCSKCDAPVRFELLLEAREGFEWHPVPIHELPVVEEEQLDAAAAGGYRHILGFRS